MTEQIHLKPKILDELIKGDKNPEDLIGENGLLKQLTKALLERTMSAGDDASSRLGKRRQINRKSKPQSAK